MDVETARRMLEGRRRDPKIQEAERREDERRLGAFVRRLLEGTKSLGTFEGRHSPKRQATRSGGALSVYWVYTGNASTKVSQPKG